LAQYADYEKREPNPSGIDSLFWEADAQTRALRKEMCSIVNKLEILLDTFLERNIDREAHRIRKAKPLNQKKGLEEQIEKIDSGSIAWVERPTDHRGDFAPCKRTLYPYTKALVVPPGQPVPSPKKF
jgi:hypothetical protein